MSTTPARPRVLLINTYLPDRRHSMKLFVKCLSESLKAFGVEVSVLSPDQRESGIAGKIFNKFILFPYHIWREGRKHDLIHVCDTSHAVFLNFLRIPSLTTVHDLGGVKEIKGKTSLLKRILSLLLLRGLARSDQLVAVSNHSSTELQELRVSHKHPPLTILNSTYQHFPVVEPSVEAWTLHFPEIPFAFKYILHLGSNEPRKNRVTVIETLGELRLSGDYHLVLAGYPPDAQLLARIAELGISAYVHNAPWPNETGLALLYRRAQALVFPSTYEGFGIPVVEAQMNYCPVVCSNIAPHIEILRGTGFIANPFDSKLMAQLILTMPNRAEVISAGIKNAAYFTPERMGSDYAEAYREVLRRRENGYHVAIGK